MMKSSKVKSYNSMLYEYIDPEELSTAITKVKRERQKKKDDILLSEYCYNQIQSLLTPNKKDRQTITNDKQTDSLDRAKTLDLPSGDNEKWSEKGSPSISNKDDTASSTAKSCLCKCSPIKRSSVAGDNETFTINNNENDTGSVKSGKKFLAYSNITVVSSYREVGVDSVDVNAEKLTNVRLKINKFLDSIASNIDLFKSPEDDIEKTQLKQKAVEFCGRFSRNHLYEIGRALNETTRALNYCLPYSQWKHVSQSKSILNVHQVVLQAFSMFQRHMRIVWGYGDTHEKLHALLQLTMEVNRICFPVQDNGDSLYVDIQNGCIKLIESLNNLFGEDNKSVASKSTLYYREITPAVPPVKILTNSIISNNRSHASKQFTKWTTTSNTRGDRYSMYRDQVCKRLSHNRKNSADVKHQRNLNNVTRRSKSAYVLTKNNSESHSKRGFQKESKSCHQICPASLSGLFKKPQDNHSTKKKTPQTNVNKSFRSRIMKTKDGTMELILPKDQLEVLEEYSNISDQLNECEADSNNQLLKSSQVVQTEDSKTTADRRAGATSAERDGARRAAARGGERGDQMKTAGGKNRDRVTKNGSNNVLLLVVKHDDSPEEKNSQQTNHSAKKKKTIKRKNIAKNKEKEVETPVTVLNTSPVDSETADDDEEPEMKDEGTRDDVRETPQRYDTARNKLKKSISADTCDAIHNYRIEFIKSLMNNPLYVQKGIKRPWEVVARISDKLIEEAVRTVAEEMEMEALLRQMVDVELKDFSNVSKI